MLSLTSFAGIIQKTNRTGDGSMFVCLESSLQQYNGRGDFYAKGSKANESCKHLLDNK